jgi:hypothetical protein
MKYFYEIREIKNNKIKEIFYFEDENEADNYINDCKNECIKIENFLIPKGGNIKDFRKEKVLNKLTNEEKKLLGLI